MNYFVSLLFTIASWPYVFAENATTSTAKATGDGHVTLNIAYYAENTCMYFKEVRPGVPESIEPTKKSLPVTVILDRKGPPCRQELKLIRHSITLADNPKILSAEIFYIGTDGRFVRSAKPRIYRRGDSEEEID